MADEFLRSPALRTERLLHDRGLQHLHVGVYGKHLIIYSGAQVIANRASASRSCAAITTASTWPAVAVAGSTLPSSAAVTNS